MYTDEEILNLFLCDAIITEFESIDLETKQNVLLYLRHRLDKFNKLIGIQRLIAYSPLDTKITVNSLQQFIDAANYLKENPLEDAKKW